MNNARIVKIEKLYYINQNRDEAALCTWQREDDGAAALCAVTQGYDEDMLGVYFPVGGTLSKEFVDYNLLTPPYAIILRASLSPDNVILPTPLWTDQADMCLTDGIFLPLSCLYSVGANLTELREGDIVNEIRGIQIYSPEKDA